MIKVIEIQHHYNLIIPCCFCCYQIWITIGFFKKRISPSINLRKNEEDVLTFWKFVYFINENCIIMIGYFRWNWLFFERAVGHEVCFPHTRIMFPLMLHTAGHSYCLFFISNIIVLFCSVNKQMDDRVEWCISHWSLFFISIRFHSSFNFARNVCPFL